MGCCPGSKGFHLLLWKQSTLHPSEGEGWFEIRIGTSFGEDTGRCGEGTLTNGEGAFDTEAAEDAASSASEAETGTAWLGPSGPSLTTSHTTECGRTAGKSASSEGSQERSSCIRSDGHFYPHRSYTCTIPIGATQLHKWAP